MKKTTLLVAVMISAAFVSCKKDRVCSCTTNTATTKVITSSSGTKTETSSSSSTDELTYTKARKGDAKSACVSYKQTDNDTYTVATYTYNVTTETTGDCKIK